jgi:hypothetical protein
MTTAIHPLTTDLQAALTGARRNRAATRAALNDLFRAGTPPTQPPDGRCAGSVALLDIAPGLTQLVEAITRSWLPWKGKTFNTITHTGQNIFTRDSLLLIRLFFPFYRGVVEEGFETYRAFRFRTWVGPGLLDPDRTVFKIDYDSPDNPGLTIRRVLDEVVQIGDGVYLGKAHLKWWWGRWQTVAYFLLEANPS